MEIHKLKKVFTYSLFSHLGSKGSLTHLNIMNNRTSNQVKKKSDDNILVSSTTRTKTHFVLMVKFQLTIKLLRTRINL